MNEEKKTVWMLSSGCYSDYGVVGIFSTEQLAREYMEAFPLEYDEYHNPQEMTIDPGDTSFFKAGRKVYSLCMNRGGNSFEIEEQKGGSLTDTESSFYFYPANSKTRLQVTCWATDEAHAVKIANEIRTQMIADGKW